MQCLQLNTPKEVRASTSKPVEQTPEQKADETIHQAEPAKAKIFPTTGEQESFTSTARIDQDYQLVGSHLDDLTKARISTGEYVDFGKLLLKDRILAEEDERLELIVKQGRTFWSPVSESVSINCYNRWEQAFRIYSDIFTRKHPTRSSELIQYNHIIHTISSTYVWENVYAYDKEFRLHIGKHPEHSWSVILQQARSMRLRDQLSKSDNSFYQSTSTGGTPFRSAHKNGQGGN